MLITTKTNTQIAVIMKTTPERFSLKWLLLSIEHALSGHKYRLYIADECPLPAWKNELYHKLKANGHHVKVWDHQVAVTIARNDLISNLRDEAFVLRVDDDFELGGEFNIDAMLRILENNEDLDFCADLEMQIGQGPTKGVRTGDIRIESGFIRFRKSRPPLIKLINDRKWKYKLTDNVRFARADYMRNLILLKRRCFEKVRWNTNLLFGGEHEDFYLELKENKLKGCFTPDSIHMHRDDLKMKSIDQKKENVWRGLDKKDIVTEFKNKWGGIPKKTKGFFRDQSWIFSKIISMIKFR